MAIGSVTARLRYGTLLLWQQMWVPAGSNLRIENIRPGRLSEYSTRLARFGFFKAHQRLRDTLILMSTLKSRLSLRAEMGLRARI
jgi:hypothetical protein